MDFDVVSLNEHGLKNKQKMQIGGYKSYTKNRFNSNMGGVSVSVKSGDAQNSLKICEGEGDNEYIVTRHNQFYPAINIINVYGCQKTVPVNTIEEKWNKILSEVVKIEMKGENVLLLGDMNVSIGNDIWGVKDNHNDVSTGGNIIRKFLQAGKHILVNNTSVCNGGPFTMVDPANKSRKSVLTQVIVSKALFPLIESMKIDKENKWAPVKATKTRKITSDHFPVILTMKDIPRNTKYSNRKETKTVWNTSKPEGWTKYTSLSTDCSSMDEIANIDPEDVTESMKKILKAQEKIKYQAFEKIKVSNSGPSNPELKKLYQSQNMIYCQVKTKAREDELSAIEEKINEKLCEAQRKVVERELEELHEAQKKGNCGAVFILKAKVFGEKKEGAEAIAIKNPANGNMVYDPEEIKAFSLKYCQELLKDKKPDNEYSFDVGLK